MDEKRGREPGINENAKVRSLLEELLIQRDSGGKGGGVVDGGRARCPL